MRDSVSEMIKAAGAEIDSAKRLLGEAGEVAWDRLLDWLVDDYFRVVALGLENIPAEGPAVIAVNHSGAWGLDAFVLDKVLGRALDRRVRFLAAPFVFRTPILGRHARRNGALPIGPTAACRPPQRGAARRDVPGRRRRSGEAVHREVPPAALQPRLRGRRHPLGSSRGAGRDRRSGGGVPQARRGADPRPAPRGPVLPADHPVPAAFQLDHYRRGADPGSRRGPRAW